MSGFKVRVLEGQVTWSSTALGEAWSVMRHSSETYLPLDKQGESGQLECGKK